MFPLRDSSTQFQSTPLPLNALHFLCFSMQCSAILLLCPSVFGYSFLLLFDTFLLISLPLQVSSEHIRCCSSRIDSMLFLCYSALIYSSTARHISVPMPFPTDLFLCIAFLSVALPFLCKAVLNNSFPLHFLRMAFYPLKYLSSSI